ncbi:nucleoside-diphosphate sugar epimerase [Aliidiomarina shirensis]|uniref:Nucleoside-diphosphate sugar epimerase n=1 Tax=Aliidiomarina shirensis TaxID=1048642 RepID=A0A432WU47_9GAMM|nr:nucleoside-diphosphate sugar epimerase/dehydratase [Aliidiomarina shirensis]RUO37292.1 nucleoside-diphosphate sugar epimerase [Aliidiomarina shirensis]
MFKRIFGLSRAQKNLIAVITDIGFLLFSIWFALSVRYETFYIPPNIETWAAIIGSTLLSILIFQQFRLYRAITRYIGQKALAVVWLGVGSSSLVLFSLSRLLSAQIPAIAIVSYALMALLLVGGSRMLVRSIVQRSQMRERERVLIYGAGASGRQLAQALNNAAEFQPVAFIDDDTTLHRSNMLGLTVYPEQQIEALISSKHVSRILLAVPSATRAQRKAILERLEPLPVQVQSIPGMNDLISGREIDTLEEVKVEDLLGRDPVPPFEHLMDKNIRGKVVMVTGAGGSIGSELCRQILRYYPKTLVLYELSEFTLYAIENDLQRICRHENISCVSIVPIMGSIQNRVRVEAVMQAFKVQTVYHAAAYKHVPMVEYNVVEAIFNNVFGTWRTAEAAISSGVESFVLVSTDKAVRPTNVMGATKRLSELVLQALAKRQDQTCFCMVRFGNVLGSSGSVIPKFREQIAAGGPVTVTNKDITRYFMTIPEAAQLVIQAGAMSCSDKGRGGEVFVLDMGEPVKINDLARKLIRLMGKSVKDADHPTGDIEITYNGLRPGEKLYEELLIGDNVRETEHPRIRTASEIDLSWPEMEALLNQLDADCRAFRIDAVHQLLQDAPLAFTSNDGISDLVWQACKK